MNLALEPCLYAAVRFQISVSGTVLIICMVCDFIRQSLYRALH